MRFPGLVVKRHVAPGFFSPTRSEAAYSRCGTYRYWLKRQWVDAWTCAFLMCNPSTATERENDRTVAKCERLARGLGAGAFVVLNLFAFRSPHPAVMRAAGDPFGKYNGRVIEHWLGKGSVLQCVCAWGVNGTHRNAGRNTIRMLEDAGLARKLYYLRLTKDGHPEHPLYIPKSVMVPKHWKDVLCNS